MEIDDDIKHHTSMGQDGGNRGFIASRVLCDKKVHTNLKEVLQIGG